MWINCEHRNRNPAHRWLNIEIMYMSAIQFSKMDEIDYKVTVQISYDKTDV